MERNMPNHGVLNTFWAPLLQNWCIHVNKMSLHKECTLSLCHRFLFSLNLNLQSSRHVLLRVAKERPWFQNRALELEAGEIIYDFTSSYCLLCIANTSFSLLIMISMPWMPVWNSSYVSYLHGIIQRVLLCLSFLSLEIICSLISSHIRGDTHKTVDEMDKGSEKNKLFHTIPTIHLLPSFLTTKLLAVIISCLDYCNVPFSGPPKLSIFLYTSPCKVQLLFSTFPPSFLNMSPSSFKSFLLRWKEKSNVLPRITRGVNDKVKNWIQASMSVISISRFFSSWKRGCLLWSLPNSVPLSLLPCVGSYLFSQQVSHLSPYQFSKYETIILI